MASDEQEVDWEHPEVRRRIAAKLLKGVTDWRASHHRRDAERDQADLHAGLTYVGYKSDAYQLARFLEESRGWAADEALVGLLADEPNHRVDTIRELIAERTPKPKVPEGPEGAELFPDGFFFKDSSGAVYKVLGVTGQARDPFYGATYAIRNRAGIVFAVHHKNIEGYIKDYGPVGPSEVW